MSLLSYIITALFLTLAAHWALLALRFAKATNLKPAFWPVAANYLSPISSINPLPRVFVEMSVRRVFVTVRLQP